MRPKIVVALGATALRAITGRSASITSMRGRPTPLPDGATLMVTVHPSYLLRIPDQESADREYRHFVEDLRQVRKAHPQRRSCLGMTYVGGSASSCCHPRARHPGLVPGSMP